MTARARALRVASAIACVFLAACAELTGPGAFRPVAGEEQTMRARVERAVAEASERQTLRAVGKLSVAGPGGSGSVKQVILVERPERLRLESLNVLGQAATMMVTDGKGYAFYDGKTLDTGAVSAEILHDRLGLAFTPAEAVGALLAAPLPVVWPARGVLARGPERAVLFADQSLHFGADGELAAIESLDANGAVRWVAEYAAWREVPGGRYPFNVVLSFPETKLRAELVLDKVELDVQIDEALFRLARESAP